MPPLLRGLVPLALLPAAAAIVTLGGATSGAGVFAILHVLRSQARGVARQISRQLSRRISRDLTRDWYSMLRQRRGDLLKLCGLLLSLKSLQSLWRALKDFDRTIHMNVWDQELDADCKRRLRVFALPAWGKGLPISPSPGVWRPYLLDHQSAQENLLEMHGMLGLTTRKPEEMTLDQMTEGVRRLLLLKHGELLTHTTHYWNEEQARSIAEALAKDNGLSAPLPAGGLDECVKHDPWAHLPIASPTWLQKLQRVSLDSLRPFFHAALSWKSRHISTPFGRMHVLDTDPTNRNPSCNQPPVLLQHGAFVTGWSMTLLGWLFTLQGRRVVMPDLFDFDHGYSASDGSLSGNAKVRRFDEHLESLACVVHDMLQGLSDSGQPRHVDLVGHSFGAILIAKLATVCSQKGYAIRKVVMLSPGGPLIKIASPEAAQFMSNPWEYVERLTPSWIPTMPVKAAVKLLLSVFFSPNNINTVLGFHYHEYLGNIHGFGTDRPVLLIWGDSDIVCRPRRGAWDFLRDRFPRLEGFWVAGADHNIQLDSVVAVAKAVDRWLGPQQPFERRSGVKQFVEALLFMTNRRLIRMDIGDQATQLVLAPSLPSKL